MDEDLQRGFSKARLGGDGQEGGGASSPDPRGRLAINEASSRAKASGKSIVAGVRALRRMSVGAFSHAL